MLGDTLLTQVQRLIGKASAILGRAEASGDDRCALQAVREVRETLHLLGKKQAKSIQLDPISNLHPCSSFRTEPTLQ